MPQQAPGWSVTSIYYHTSVSAGADVARAREIRIGNIPANLNVNVNANVNANVNLGLVAATYTFAKPVLGGQHPCHPAGDLRLQLDIACGIAGGDSDDRAAG